MCLQPDERFSGRFNRIGRLTAHTKVFQSAESVIALRKAKVANAQIKEGLEKAGVDFFVLTQLTEPPVTMQTQLHQIVHEAVESAFV